MLKKKSSLLFLVFGVVILIVILFFKKPIPEEVNPPIDNPSLEESSYLNHWEGQEVDSHIKQVIIEYMDAYYKSMKNLVEEDMTYLFHEPNGEQASINQTAISLLVEIRKMKPLDLSLSDMKYDLNIVEVKEEENKVKVLVKESNYLHFNFMKEIESRVYNIENEFTLVKINEQYKIEEYKKVQDFFVMITDKYSKDSKNLEQIKQEYLNIMKQTIEQDRKDYHNFLNGVSIDKKVCDRPYRREEALQYAKKWVNKRNEEWSTFDANCQNYASQVVYNGGVPMDYLGSALNHLQWKFYNPSYNEKQIASGYLYTWTYVPYFYTYAKTNTGLGLCASVDVNLYYAEAGDIIHVGIQQTDSGPGKHALVVIGPYIQDNQVIDILVNSNTVDLENYPMSAYVYPYSSLIKIYGYND